MASQRLTFLYPQLFKPAQLNELRLCVRARPHRRKRHVTSVAFSTTSRAYQEEVSQRYGSAQGSPLPPLPPPPKPSKPAGEKSLAAAIETEVKGTPESGEKKAEGMSKESNEKAKSKKEASQHKTDSEKSYGSKNKEGGVTALESQTDKSSTKQAEPRVDQAETRPVADREATTKDRKVTTLRPLETVFKIPAPTAEKPEEHKAPHMQAPPYVHHFDTYTLVRDLEKGGFTQDQSVTLMKAVRTLLVVNMDVARDGLVGKSDRENETYLFRAACSELRTEILNARRASSSNRQTQLHHLQHSIDILSQRVSQETLAFKDDLRGMLNERRMASREQSQQRDSEISELNYRISARLIGDSKSEVEGLRWTLTRRSALAIAAMAVMILASLRLGSLRLQQEREVEERKRAAAAGKSGEGADGGGGGGSGSYTVGSREMGTQTGDEALVNKGESVGYVSLG